MAGVLSAVQHDTRQSSGDVSVHTIVDLVCAVPNTLYFFFEPEDFFFEVQGIRHVPNTLYFTLKLVQYHTLQKWSQRSPCLTA